MMISKFHHVRYYVNSGVRSGIVRRHEQSKAYMTFVRNRIISQVRTLSSTTTNTSTNKDPMTTIILQNNTTNTHTKYPKLFTPLNLGNDIGILPNRILMGSMHSGLEHHSMPSILLPLLGTTKTTTTSSSYDRKEPLHKMAEYFKIRAQGGVGLMVTGGIAPNMNGWTSPFSSQLTSQHEMHHHEIVTKAVHSIQIPIIVPSTSMNHTDDDVTEYHQQNPNNVSSVPARICLQILHTGRYGYHPFVVSASTTKSPISPFTARALSMSGIQRTIRDFVQTATLAQQAGYDGIEIMGSEGYLLSQFISPCTNHRTDQYGNSMDQTQTSFQNRTRLPIEIIQQTRAAVGPNFIIIYRLSLLDLVQNGVLLSEAIELAQMVEHAGATIINTGIGWHEARIPTIATSVPRGAFAFTTKALKDANVVSIPLIATNRINHPMTAEHILSNSSADLVSMARPFLADPEFVNKSREGKEDEINTCIGCNQACLDHVFVGKVASCLVNPIACHETELVFPNNVPPLHIGVIGAGPAGCSFAITAAKLGHHVTLYDKDHVIGGQFNMAKRIPGKEEFHETIRYFTTMLQKYHVNVQLQTEITHEQLLSLPMDKWIIATGVLPRDPKIPGQDHPHVLSYIDVLRHKKSIGNRVAVIGAGGIGFDVSEYILHYTGTDRLANDVSVDEFYKTWGIDPRMEHRGGLCPPELVHQHTPQRKIYLLQRKKGKLGAGLGKTTGWIHRATLNQSGQVEMIDNITYERIDENGYLHIKQNGVQRILEVDNVVICAGQVEYRDLQDTSKWGGNDEENRKLSSKVYTIGGAYAAGELDAKRAIDMGTRLALKIHEPHVIPGQHIFAAEVGVEEKLYQFLRKYIK